MHRNSVLLPPPEGPMIVATSPRRTESETPSSTRRSPWFFTRLRTSIMVSDAGYGMRGTGIANHALQVSGMIGLRVPF